MLSPSTENKTDTIKLTIPVKKVEEDALSLDNDGKKFSIIIPAYNEEKRIKPVLEEIVSYLTESASSSTFLTGIVNLMVSVLFSVEGLSMFFAAIII